MQLSDCCRSRALTQMRKKLGYNFLFWQQKLNTPHLSKVCLVYAAFVSNPYKLTLVVAPRLHYYLTMLTKEPELKAIINELA